MHPESDNSKRHWIGGSLSFFAGVLTTSAALGANPIGTEFQINSYTTSTQRNASLAVEADGDFVVTWQSDGSVGNDNSSHSIQGQRYDSSGNPLGAQFQVNTYTSNVQRYPSVSSDSDGDFVVVWDSQGSAGSDGYSRSIQGQRFGASGSALGAQFQVNTYVTSSQYQPDVAVEADGDFVVVWSSVGSAGSDTSSTSVQGQRYDENGNTVGGQFQLNTHTTSWQFDPSVSVNASGNFVVAWQSYAQAGSDTDNASIQAQRYNVTGSVVGAEFQVNSYTTNQQRYPAVGIAASGVFVITWTSYGSVGDDNSGSSIQGRRYSASGSSLGGQFQVNTHTDNAQRKSSVSMDTAGNFAVTWESGTSASTDSSGYSIHGQRYDSSGNTIGTEFQVNTYTTSNQYSPPVGVDENGDFVVAWHSAGSSGSDTSGYSIQGQRFELFNSKAGTNVVVSPPAADENGVPIGTSPVTFTFDEITGTGETRVTVGGTGPAPPAGFMLGTPPTYFDLETSASFTGDIAICIDYSGISFSDEASLKLFHDKGSHFVNVTSFLDAGNDIICGVVNTLSYFLVVEPDGGPTPTPETPTPPTPTPQTPATPTPTTPTPVTPTPPTATPTTPTPVTPTPPTSTPVTPTPPTPTPRTPTPPTPTPATPTPPTPTPPTPIPGGPEFRVNTYTTSMQSFPSVSTDASGNFVVVWQSDGSTGSDVSDYSIQGQRYDDSGVAIGTEFQVNTYTYNQQRYPSVGGNANGNFVVVWSSYGSAGSDTSLTSIQGQRYDASGNAIGAEFQVNTYTTSSQSRPSVSMDSNGNFVVVWDSYGSGGGDPGDSIQGQRYDASGNTVGAQFQVNTSTTSMQAFPSVSVDADGDFVVVWNSAWSSGNDSDYASIQGQRYDSSGNAVGDEFQVNTYTTSNQNAPAVSSGADGDFVVVWDSDGSGGSDDLASSIQGQRYDASGSTVAAEFQINTYTTSYQLRPSVAIDENGDFVVTWFSDGSAGDDTEFDSIQGQRYDSSGNPVGTEFQVNTHTTGSQLYPAVAIDDEGDFVVAWNSYPGAGGDTSGYSVQARAFVPEPSEFLMMAAGIAFLATVGRRRIKA